MEQIKYEKILVINDQSNDCYEKCFYMLTKCMFDSLKSKKEHLLFFKANLTYSEKSVNAMDLKFEWSSFPNQPERLNPETTSKKDLPVDAIV